MARNHANNGRIYRAVVVRTMADGRVHTYTYGPYDKPGPAKGQITGWKTAAERSHGERRDPAHAFTVNGWVESAEVIWMHDA